MKSPGGWRVVASQLLKAVETLTELTESLMNRAELFRQRGECRAAARLGAEGRRRVTDERPASLLGEYQALIAELTVCALHGHELHAEILGELPRCGQLGARFPLAACDFSAVLRSDLLGRRLRCVRSGFHSSERNRT